MAENSGPEEGIKGVVEDSELKHLAEDIAYRVAGVLDVTTGTWDGGDTLWIGHRDGRIERLLRSEQRADQPCVVHAATRIPSGQPIAALDVAPPSEAFELSSSPPPVTAPPGWRAGMGSASTTKSWEAQRSSRRSSFGSRRAGPLPPRTTRRSW